VGGGTLAFKRRVWDRPIAPVQNDFHLKWRVLVKLTEKNDMKLIADRHHKKMLSLARI